MLCTILHCEPSDLMEFVYDEKEEQEYLQKIEDFKNGIRKNDFKKNVVKKCG